MPNNNRETLPRSGKPCLVLESSNCSIAHPGTFQPLELRSVFGQRPHGSKLRKNSAGRSKVVSSLRETILSQPHLCKVPKPAEPAEPLAPAEPAQPSTEPLAVPAEAEAAAPPEAEPTLPAAAEAPAEPMAEEPTEALAAPESAPAEAPAGGPSIDFGAFCQGMLGL